MDVTTEQLTLGGWVYWRNQRYARREVRKMVNLGHIHFIIKGNQLEEKSVEAKS